jgi:UDP-N-acetylmuramoyl-tripeptide--D-alanyl-D-alanine ligase
MTATWTPAALSDACGGEVVSGRDGSPTGFTIDTREVTEGDLFIGIPGQRTDGGSLAAAAVQGGAWGAIVAPQHGAAVAEAGGAAIVHPDPAAALGLIAAAHRRTLDCQVIGVTGSSGKTSTKDILSAVLSGSGPTVASRGNRNTEIGMPLEILRADSQTRFLVLEMAMRGAGQISQLEQIAKPDVGVVVSIGPAHLDLLGSIEAIAAAKAELIAGLHRDATAVVPAAEPLLEPHLRDDLRTLRFGPGGDVYEVAAEGRDLVISLCGDQFEISVNFDQPHNRLNLLAALAAAYAVGVRPPRNLEVEFSSLETALPSIEKSC